VWVDYKPINVEMDDDKYLLLTEFEVRTVTGQKRGSVTYSTDRENSVSKIFIISLRLIRRAGKETSQSQAEGSTATKIAVPKFQKLNLFGC